VNRTRRWAHVERQIGTLLRLFYLFMALWLWRGSISPLFSGERITWWGVYAFFALVVLGITFVSWGERPGWQVFAVSQGVDLAFVTYIITRLGVPGGPAVWLYAPWLAKQVLLASDTTLWYLVAFAIGPLYTLALYVNLGSWAFARDPIFWQSLAVLFALAAAGLALSRHIRRLQEALAHEREDLARKTEIVQRTATDLGARVLELRALQEVAHHLSTSLHLEQTLDVITQRARDLFNVPRAGVALREPEGDTWRLVPAPSEESRDWRPLRPSPALVAQLAQAASVVIQAEDEQDGDRGDASLLHPLPPAWQHLDLVALPLITRGRLIAVLLLADRPGHLVFGEQQQQLADSFAFFAATAIENARLYENVLNQRQELEAVLQGIGDAVLVTDPSLNVILMNPVAMRTFHLDDPPPSGMSLDQVVKSEDLRRLLQDVLAGEKPVVVKELDLTTQDEKPRTFQAVASAVRSQGQSARGVVTVLRDITAQKELERMKSNFLSVVSHELKTPLHSIKGFVEIIRMGKAGPVTDLQQDFLTTVKEQTQVLQRMIDDLLVFSRLEAGQLRLQVEEVSLAAIVAGVVQKLTPLAEERNLTLTTRLPDDFPDVEGDYMRLEQVVTNLVENAIKFTPPGGSVTVDGEDLEDHARVWVQDTGIGIPESEYERVFERFYQVDASERRAYRGTGLGLTICKHIITHHHGRIWVESRVGEGSTFYIELPKRLPAVAGTLDFYSTEAVGR